MATLVLGALGTLVGGPIGGAIGALAGRQLDGMVIGGGRREGPRLKDLAISTSSYGQPIARVFGRARVAGSIIWATDLVERQSRSGGGKGKPSVTTFSYSSSFAIALSSRPIQSLGRIWADGQLLRGSAGDLKSGGTIRVHTGHGDQPRDPLLASALGPECPAFRDCAYAVFEDLQLADFGNRIPALSFEVFADEAPLDLADVLAPAANAVEAARPLPGLLGLEQLSGTLADTTDLLGLLYPLDIDTRGETLRLETAAQVGDAAVVLPPPAISLEEGGFGARTGAGFAHPSGGPHAPAAVRYYDAERDYQPGIQRREGGRDSGSGNGDGGTVEYPAVFSASTARGLLREAWVRSTGSTVLRQYRIATLDPALGPGALVTIPGEVGQWSVIEWEWNGQGIDLVLRRVRAQSGGTVVADAGAALSPADLTAAPTWLRAIELPLDDVSSPDVPRRFLAVSSGGAGWSGAALQAADGPSLIPIGTSGRQRSVVGTLASPLPPSPALVIERDITVLVDLIGSDMALEPVSEAALANGANRMLVGSELLQFLDAVPLGGGRWRLQGLLRGRGGTEPEALGGQSSGALVTALDGPLIDVQSLASEAARAVEFAAIGMADETPVTASLDGAGITLRPLCPVHPRARTLPGGELSLGWNRRARGAWLWRDGVDTPLVEQGESYLVGAGNIDQPLRLWETAGPSLTLGAADIAALPAGTPMWVRQQGTHALSAALLLYRI